VPWDFHAVRPEWRGAVDFVYSNALDHSFNATLAISSWLEELAPGGAVLVTGAVHCYDDSYYYRGGVLSNTD